MAEETIPSGYYPSAVAIGYLANWLLEKPLTLTFQSKKLQFEIGIPRDSASPFEPKLSLLPSFM